MPKTMLMASTGRVESEASNWVQAHEALSRLARERAAADADEGRCLMAALRSAAHVHLGFGSFGEYIERLFGYKRRTTQEKLRVAEALEGLPAMARALEAGALSWSAVRELTRVAAPETERQWLEVAFGKTVRQLEQLVEGMSPGDEPGRPRSPSEQRHVLRFEVAPETFALFREAITQLRRRTGSVLDDDSALLLMARHVLGGSSDEGRASYQIALTVCAQCGIGHQQAGGELIAVGSDVVESAHCDAQHLGQLNAPANENAAAAGADTNEGAHAGARQYTEIGHAPVHSAAADRTQNAHAHVGADGVANDGAARLHAGGQDFRAVKRATQAIPPARRRAVLRRDHGRCRAPGCSNSTFVDLHHIELRSEGGQNEPANLVTLCSAHHRATHRGELLIAGSATAPSFRHADGSEYGHVQRPHGIETQAKVFSALRHLGFREGEVRSVLAELRKLSDLREATAELLLREALRRLAPTGAKPTYS